MYQDSRPLDNPINWSFRVGRVWGVTVRVHIVFVICAVVVVWASLPRQDDPFAPTLLRALVNGLGIYVILFGVVLLHEFGHCWGARRAGGTADDVLLWPLGGLAFTNPPPHWRAHLMTTVAGPMVNVVICAITSAALAAWTGSLLGVPWNPIHPFQPVGDVRYSEGQFWLAAVYGVSYFLLVINLLPVFPFDGGRILQSLLWRSRGFAASMEIATGTGMVGAIVIGLCALFLKDADWILLGVAVFGYMTCWQTRRWVRETGGLMGDGFATEGYGGSRESWEEAEAAPGPYARWKTKREEAQRRKVEEQERAHEEAVEAILRKVSLSGLASLTPRERATLERETERKRAGRA